MATPRTPQPENTEQTRVWIEAELLAWVDAMAERDKRSRSYIINQGMNQWRKKIEDQRKRRAKR